jgi:excisionase family DNA binding protein
MKRLTVRQVSEQLGVSPGTVRTYAKMGWLSFHITSGRTGPGQRFYFNSDEVEAFAKGGAFAAKSFREQEANDRIKPRRGRGYRSFQP